MRLKTSLVCATAGAVIAGSAGLSGLLTPAVSASPSPTAMDVRIMTGPTGNKVEMVDPAQSTYVPRIARASDADRAQARDLLRGANRFCRTHSVDSLQSRWRPGRSKPAHPTHLFNPKKRKARGLHPRNPRAALVYDGKLGGVMFTGTPLPSLGSIPRAHSHHDMSMGSTSMNVEMVHVYCTKSLKEAFTPNRVLGVKSDLRALRDRMRPAVMDLHKAQLRAVRHKVRHYAGNKLDPVRPVGSSSGPGPDPVMQAMRTEIRHSLMILSEHQLRSVWRLMRSY